MRTRLTCRDLADKYDRLHAKLDEIALLAKTTNGRVKGLEMWRNFITGGLTVLCILIVPIFLFVLYHHFKF